jgi:hypothetical protein
MHPTVLFILPSCGTLGVLFMLPSSIIHPSNQASWWQTDAENDSSWSGIASFQWRSQGLLDGHTGACNERSACEPRAHTNHPTAASAEAISFTMDYEPMGTQVGPTWGCPAIPDEWKQALDSSNRTHAVLTCILKYSVPQVHCSGAQLLFV